MEWYFVIRKNDKEGYIDVYDLTDNYITYYHSISIHDNRIKKLFNRPPIIEVTEKYTITRTLHNINEFFLYHYFNNTIFNMYDNVSELEQEVERQILIQIREQKLKNILEIMKNN